MTKVLHVITDDRRRGAQVFGFTLAQRLDELGLEDRVVALKRAPDGTLEVPILGRRSRGPATLRGLRREMSRADVTIAHGSSTLMACAIAGLGHRPFVYRQVSDPVFWTRTRGRRLRTQVLYRFPARVTSLSPRTAAVLAERFKIQPKRITVIPNAADERAFPLASSDDRARARARLGVDGSRPVIACIGALVLEKGVHDLLEALPSQATLVMAGSGTEEASLRAKAEERSLDVRFLGTVDDPGAVYDASDLVVIPSWSEQQPAAVLEAALTGKACVASNVGLLDELIVDGTTGWLVPARDPAALRAAIEAALHDRDHLAAMGRSAHYHVAATLSFEAVAPRWAALIESLAG